MATLDIRLKLKAQLFCGDEIAIGPGKAALLEAIREQRSISGAGRALGMSYRRTWLLVDVMNRCWEAPLVMTNTGGRRGGGASLTAMGEHVLAHYRALEAQLEQVTETADWSALVACVVAAPRPRGGG